MLEPELPQSTPVIRRALALLDAVFGVVSDPSRLCQGAWARDADGNRLTGPLDQVLLSPKARSRCVFGELLVQGLAHGYRIELAAQGQLALELRRAPASFWLAANALAHAAAYVIRENLLDPALDLAELGPVRQLSRGEWVLSAPIALNEYGSYAEVVWSVVLAGEMLRAHLDRRERVQ